eukprot:5031936-Prymnesium_polylepis.1
MASSPTSKCRPRSKKHSLECRTRPRERAGDGRGGRAATRARAVDAAGRAAAAGRAGAERRGARHRRGDRALAAV